MLIEQISNYQPTTTFKSTVRGAPKSNSRQYSFIQPQQNDSVREFDSNYTIVTTAEGMEKEEFHGSLLKTNNTQLEWLHSLSFIDDVINSSRNSKRDWTYGWIQLLEPIPENELEQDLSLFESSVIGISGAMIRVKFPKNREYLKQIQKLSWIQGAGVQPTSTKISPDFDEELQNSSAATLHPLFITVMSVGDAEHYRQTIQNLGVKVGYFDPNIRVFEVVSPSSLISSLMTLDFVQFIEPIRIAKSNHDSAVQAMGVDSIRKIGETIGEFTGFNGSSIPIAVADTGLNTNHVSINSFRESICGENFVPGEDRDLWIDEETHGTHVTGTVAAVGYYQPLYAGMAPGVQDIRFAKVLNKKGFGSFSWVHRGMDFLAEHSSCPSEGWSDLKQQPLIVNMSLSAESLTFDAKESGARKLDSIVWSHRQLYTVAASNSNIHGYSNYGAAKNSLAVGASHDVGDVSSFSSHGPTVDGRLLPNVTGTGVGVISTLGNGSYDGYQALQGTSMSSPAVAGVAALIMEAAPAHQNHPALIRARLMASAIKPDPWFDSEVHFPSNNTTGPGSYHAAYGLGFVSARTSIVNLDDPNGWTSSGVTFDVDQNEVAYHDIDVPSGTSRLDVVLTWDEPTSDTIANVVLNDLDLFLDHEADCGTGACGEHSSQSSIDNVEWVIIRNPDPGTYRIKVSGSRVFTKLRGGLAWTIVRGDATPQLSINTDRQSFTSGGGSHVHEHTVELTVESSGYVATGTNLYIDCRTQDDTPCSEFGTRASEEQRNFSGSVNREDGLTLEQEDVGTFFLGEIAYGEEQSVTLHLFSSLAEDLNISFTTSAFNAAPSSTTVKFLVEDSDGAGLSDPEPPTNDASTSPMILDGPEGSIDIDTLVASTESGECGLFLGQRRVLRTLWYEWQPNSQDLVSFIASPQRNTPNWYAKEFAPRIDIFEVVGDEPGFTSLDHIATSPWSIQWFPKLESTYRIRVSNSHGSLPLTMSWFVGEQPVNDNFADALVLSGDSGTIDGHNLGATTEAGEEYGSLAASIWYQWEAPSDGTWEFQIKNAQVVFLLIFTGDTIDDLRLMSGVYDPGEKVALEAAAGEIYYLMVSSPDVNSGGWKFEELTWETSSSVSFDYGDSFENPWHFSDESFGSFTIHSTSRNTVEPDEPEVSGVQTTWAKWTAPESGIYTWYWNENPHRTNVMTGDSLDSLVATTYDDTSYSRHELLLDAEKDQEYYFSVGREKTDTDAFKLGSVNLHHFSWGIAPENNSMDGALLLTGSEGLIEGESRYATTAPIGLHRYGYSSLWYTFTAEEGGWYKFRLNSPWEDSYILAAFQQSDSDGELTVLGTSFSSYFLGQGVEILIHVEEGKSIFVRVGNKYNHNESSFTMNWEPTNAPQWMKFIGRLGNGFRDAANKVVNIRDPSDIQFDDSGRSMFVSTSRGILVFEREESSGLLTFIQELNEVPKDASLIWDYHRERLYVNEYRDWWVYKRKSNLDSMELELDYTFQDGISVRSYTWTNGPILHMENDGNYLYKFRGDFNRTKYGFTEEGKLKQLQFRRNLDFALVNLQPHVNGSHWYSLNSNSARLVRRDVGGGDLRFVSCRLYTS
ncbi:MAG: S8 family serine peptidase, partial [Gammaproteobacteria bacterium]|nr:S8 family serine peptidase [Gammaproteobacteria bacterium]